MSELLSQSTPHSPSPAVSTSLLSMSTSLPNLRALSLGIHPRKHAMGGMHKRMRGEKDKQAGSSSQIHKTISDELPICLHDCISDERINNLTGYLFRLGSVCHYLPALC